MSFLHRFTPLGCSLLALAGAAQAQVEASVVMTQGEVLVDGAPANRGMALQGAIVRTGADGQVQLRTANGSMIVLTPASELRLSKDKATSLALVAGGLRLSAVGSEWLIELPDRSIRTNGYLRLAHCGSGCSLQPGLYGRIAQGEAVLEYQGGRSVLRSRSFRWPSASARPEVLVTQPAILDDSSSAHAAAARARGEINALLKVGIEAFEAGNDGDATRALERVRTLAPAESLVPYYLGLIALRKEDHASAQRLLQQYANEDPEGAAAREVPKTLTLLSSAQLQQEVAAAVEREREVVASPPEPGSIAVQAFVNRGNEAYRAMAKGLAAMIIADLAKVPGLKVLEREKVQLLVNEARLGDSGLADTASAVRSGRLMRAEKVVVGNFEVQ